MQEVYFEINFHLLFYIKTSIGFSCNYSNIVSVKILIFYIFYLYIYTPLHILYLLYSTLLILFIYILIKKKCLILSIIILALI